MYQKGYIKPETENGIFKLLEVKNNREDSLC